MTAPVKFRVEVIRVTFHDVDVATFEFRYLDRRPRYKPGQFLHLALDPYDPSGHWPESRVFTVAKGATDREFIRLTIAQKGAFTTRIMKELRVGRQVWMKGPYGKFIVQSPPESEIVLIGGGTGVTPFVGFMEDILAKGLEGKVWLHYGAREPGLLIFHDLADTCATRFSTFRVKYYAEKDAPNGVVSGRIDLDEACESIQDMSKAVFYLCGPPPMTDLFRERLESHSGVSRQNIRVDAWD